MSKKAAVIPPTTAKEFAIRAAAHGLNTLEHFSDNPHDYSKTAGHLNETIRILHQIEWEEQSQKLGLEWGNNPPIHPAPPKPMPNDDEEPSKSEAALRRLAE